MKILVTGGSGFVGTHLIDALRQHQDQVRVFDLDFGQDIRDYEQIRHEIEMFQPDRIYHLAAQAFVAESVTDPARAFTVNTLGTVNLLEACRQIGSHARILITGTSEEYGYTHQLIGESTPLRPATPYGASKAGATLAGLAYTEQYGLHVVITRAFNHTGPGQSPAYALPAFARRIVHVEQGIEPCLTHGNLDAWRDFLDVRDVIRAYMMAIECAPGIYNVCRGDALQMSDYVKRMTVFAAREIPTKLDEHLHRKTPGNNFTATARKLQDCTAWQPEWQVDDMLHSLLDYWRSVT